MSKGPTAAQGTRRDPARGRQTALILLLSLAIQLALLAYAAHVDANPVAGVRYTDVDWRVVYDGLKHVAHPSEANLAAGPLADYLRPWIRIGSPYARATFRYTPLLVLVLAPALVAPLLGRLVLVALTLALPAVLLSDPAVSPWKVHALWTLNPVVLNITTRGSPEALPCLLTAVLAISLRRAGLGAGYRGTRVATAQETRWEAVSAAALALAASYKIYPAIYVPAIWRALARRHGWLGAGVWRFAAVGAAVTLVVNGALWAIWGAPFLEHTFTYHLARLDHRHNFSPYFLPIYLNLTSPASPASLLLAILRHPLASFLPQASAVLLAGAALEPRLGVAGALFFQTAIFVVFNKVCTSQYFLWPLPLVPLLHLPRLSWPVLAACLAAWVGAQALWLGTAYRLEFLAQPVYVPLWAAGCLLFVVSAAGIGALLDGI